MGEPGSKIVLTILTRLTLQALLQTQKFNKDRAIGLMESQKFPFQSAGDDQILIGKKDFLEKFQDFAPRFSLKPSLDKWRIYRHGA